jgi:hypothetical protein
MTRPAHLKIDASTHLGRQRPAAATCARTGYLRGWYGQYLSNEQEFLFGDL